MGGTDKLLRGSVEKTLGEASTSLATGNEEEELAEEEEEEEEEEERINDGDPRPAAGEEKCRAR